MALITAPDIHAATATWTGNNQNWTDTSFWSTGVYPNGTADEALHATGGSFGMVQNVVGLTLGRIEQTGGTEWVITGTGANSTITLNNGVAGPAVIRNSSTSTSDLNRIQFATTVPLLLADDLLVENASSSTRQVGGVVLLSTISGTGNITFSNNSHDIATLKNSINVAATNTFTGNVTIKKGLVTVSGTPFGAAANTVTLGESGQGAATLTTASNVSITLPNAIVVASSAGGNLTIGANNTGSAWYDGAITLNGDLNVSSKSINTDAVFLRGIVSGSGSLIMSGTGRVAMTRANDYTGQTNVNSGILRIDAGGSLANTSLITVSSNATMENANGASVGRPLSLSEGSTLKTLATSSAFAPTTLTITGDLSDGFTAIALTNTAGSGLLKSGGTLVLTLSNMAVGNYNLSSGTGFSGVFGSASINSFSLSTSDFGATFTGGGGGFGYTFTNATNVLSVAVVPEPATVTMLLGGIGMLVLVQRRRRR
jgi:autotransporter-associated beta strand protein